MRMLRLVRTSHHESVGEVVKFNEIGMSKNSLALAYFQYGV